MYQLFRRILFLFPTEWVHYFSMNLLKALCSFPPLRKFISTIYSVTQKKSLKTSVCHLEFNNPIGLGAGFDKNAKWLRELEALGFGFVEIGTVTPVAQPGNEKPRLFRLPKDKALINRMGFNNDGVKKIASRLKKWKESDNVKRSKLIIGGNIGKNKLTPNDEAW
jgi:dihydroorotate dehydrogenase